MTRKLFLLLFVFYISINYAQQDKILYVASWNVENLFDTLDEAQKDDNEFLPTSESNWNTEKYVNKIKNLARVINDMNDQKGPDILGLVEIENFNVLSDLVKNLNRKYSIAHVESLDPRGIDNALIYDTNLFKLKKLKPLHVVLDTLHSETRYILKVELEFINFKKNKKITVYVNHWPSRRGGEETSEKYRINAAKTLIKELNNSKINNVIILGDFNDEPINKSILEILSAQAPQNYNKKDTKLINLAYDLKEQGNGTYFYRGDWNMIDQMIISKDIYKSSNEFISYITNSFNIFKQDYMITKEGKYKGSCIPTFGGKKYLGGFSDHYPIFAKFLINYGK